MQSHHPEQLRVGLCGIGLDAYWPQFAGLDDQLEQNLTQVQQRLESFGVHVTSLGMVDTPQRSVEAGHACRRADIDLLLLYVTTYALSSTVLPLVQRAGVPLIVLTLQPGAHIDYEGFNRLPDRTAMTGHWLAWCSACPVPEIANVLRRARIPFPAAWTTTVSALKQASCWHSTHSRYGTAGLIPYSASTLTKQGLSCRAGSPAVFRRSRSACLFCQPRLSSEWMARNSRKKRPNPGGIHETPQA